jgi:hypothetical protein
MLYILSLQVKINHMEELQMRVYSWDCQNGCDQYIFFWIVLGGAEALLFIFCSAAPQR